MIGEEESDVKALIYCWRNTIPGRQENKAYCIGISFGCGLF